MSKRELLKPGDRVRVYSAAGVSEVATVERVTNEDCLEVQSGDQRLYVHPKQCRRLRKKNREPERKRRQHLVEVSTVTGEVVHHWGDPRDRNINFSPTDPSLVLFHEIRPGERVISREELVKAWFEMVHDLKHDEGLCDGLARQLGLDQEGGGGA